MQSFHAFLKESTLTEETHAYHVHLKGKHIDTVFYGHHEPVEEVKRSLINHDGYHPDIRVSKERKSYKDPHEVTEEIQLDELSKGTLHKYIAASIEDVRYAATRQGSAERASDYEERQGRYRAAEKLRDIAADRRRTSMKHMQGVKLAAKKLAKEETQLTEVLKPLTQYTYVPNRGHFVGGKKGDSAFQKHQAEYLKRKKITPVKEETQLTELTASTLKNYIKKSSQDLNVQSSLRAHYARDYDKKTSTPADVRLLNTKHRKVTSRLRGIGTAAERLAGRSDWD